MFLVVSGVGWLWAFVPNHLLFFFIGCRGLGEQSASTWAGFWLQHLSGLCVSYGTMKMNFFVLYEKEEYAMLLEI